MKVEDLDLFTMVVRLGGFTAAANALDLPRSNVSRRINKLEEELNAQLFFRTTRQLSLTRYGQSYFDEVVKALEALERAKHITTQIAEAPKGCVKVGLLPETDEAISPILFSFLDMYPDIELDIRSINNGFVDTYQQNLDVAFHAGEIIDSNLVARQLSHLNGTVVASPEYVNQHGYVNHPNELLDNNCICFRWPNGQVDNCWRIEDQDYHVSGNITSNSIGLIKRAVLESKGIGFLPNLLINNEIKEGELLTLMPDFDSPYQNQKIWLLYPETKGISRATRLLIEYLAKEVPRIS